MNYFEYLVKFCQNNKENIARLLSQSIKIKSYSGKETKFAKFLLNFLKKEKLNVKKIKNNIIILINCKNKKCKILYDAHIDTVAAENSNKWLYPPFSGKVNKDKIYGRGSCDDKASVISLIFTALFLKEIKYDKYPIAISLSSEEENSSAKGIKQVLSHIKPEYCVICEPSDLKIVYGHKGKWSVKFTFFGKTAHSSAPHLGKNAIYLAYPLIKNLIEGKNKNFMDSPLGEPIYTITYIESKTNSLNSLPYECSLYIDYRTVLGETEDTVKKFLTSNIKEKKYKFSPQHEFLKAWILNENHQFLKVAKNIYKTCFNKLPKPLIWQFCTNGSITMAEYNIPTIGFGPGNPFLAHQDNEYVKISDILEAIKFYSMLAINLK